MHHELFNGVYHGISQSLRMQMQYLTDKWPKTEDLKEDMQQIIEKWNILIGKWVEKKEGKTGEQDKNGKNNELSQGNEEETEASQQEEEWGKNNGKKGKGENRNKSDETMVDTLELRMILKV